MIDNVSGKSQLVKLTTNVGGISLKLPFMQASGILGGNPEALEIVAKGEVGALVTKSITPHPRKGNDPPIIVEVECGYVNAVGLSNPGKAAIPKLVEVGRKYNLPVIVSVAGSNVNDFTEVAWFAEDSGASAIELNLSCPHAKGMGLEIGMDRKLSRLIVESVSTTTKIPVFVKMGYLDSLVERASEMLEAGADVLVLINTLRAMKVDVYSMKPVLTNLVGGLSGPAIKPIALRAVYEVYKELKAPIIGVGGISKWEDVVEFMLVGARAVQVGSILAKKGIGIFSELKAGLIYWMNEMGFKNLDDFIGAAVD